MFCQEVHLQAKNLQSAAIFDIFYLFQMGLCQGKPENSDKEFEKQQEVQQTKSNEVQKALEQQGPSEKKQFISPRSEIIPIEAKQFILSALNNPKKLSLLFRASQHKFLASQFHFACDDIPHTFTVILTEFGKIIAGYTPLRWQSTHGGQYVDDPSMESFLLSFDRQEKMNLVNPERAIMCHSHYGPVFGGSGGCDICIQDKCNKSDFNSAYFPSNYNSKTNFQRNQQSWTLFSGATQSQYFKVLEYEVYRVEW